MRDLQIPADKFHYWGDKKANDPWRIGISGKKLRLQVRENGSWVSKTRFTRNSIETGSLISLGGKMNMKLGDSGDVSFLQDLILNRSDWDGAIYSETRGLRVIARGKHIIHGLCDAHRCQLER